MPKGMWRPQIQFDLLEVLGEGSQGTVYKAFRRDRSSGMKQLVAVKVLHSRTAVGMWRQEFESLARVRSPYCVRVLSFERVKRRPALVLEFIDGVSLSQIARGCNLTEADSVEITAQLEAALKDLHRFGIFHGDLSPHNILLDGEGRIHLLDFGLANCSAEQRRLTPEFAAPERIAGSPASLASDLFSLGQIQRFIRGEDLRSSSVSSPYLHSQPSLRRFAEVLPDPALQSGLGERVREFQRRQKFLSAVKTRSVLLKAKFKPSLKEFVLGALTALIFLTTSSAQQIRHKTELGILAVKTNRWHKLQLNGRDLGYPPFSVNLAAGTTHVLEWSSALGTGKKKILVKPNQTLVLEDRDFSH
jgi:serine/threonine protein kinase